MRIFLIALIWSFVLAGAALAEQSESAWTQVKESGENAGATVGDTAARSQADSPQSGPLSEESSRKRKGLNEVVVTAERYSEVAYNVPIHLSVMSTQDLQRLDINDVNRMQFFVPGMSTLDSDTQSRIAIDGVANVNGNGSEVSEYIDDADVTASPTLYAYNVPDYSFYDLARVEVLRGPQGTLYGEGAEGGAIHFITNKPDLTHFDAGLRAQMLFTAGGQPTQRVFPVLNVPMGASFGVRISGQYSHDGGWIDQKAAAVKGINATDVSDTRLEALWRPSREFNVALTQVVHNRKFSPEPIQSASEMGYDPLGLYETPQASETLYLTNVDLNFGTPRVAMLTSSTTWLKSAVITNGISVPEPPEFGGIVFKWIANDYRYQHYSEEVRLHHSGSGPWQWVIGGLVKRVAVNSFPTTFCGFPFGTTIPVTVPPYLSLPPSFATLISALSQSNPSAFCAPLGQEVQSKSSSEFANASYDVSGRATIAIGVRHFRNPESSFAAGTPAWQSGVFSSTDPSLSILYRLTNHLNVYARAAKGFRSGGFNGYGAPPFGPESLWNYAIGVKTRKIVGLTASAEAYYSKWSDVQNFAKVPSGNIVEALVESGGAVHIKGANVAIQWQPTVAWEVDINGGYVDSRWAALGGTDAASDVGDPVDGVPRYQVNASVERNFNVRAYESERPAYVRVDYSQQAPWALRNRPFGFYAVGDHLYILDLEAGVQWNESVSFAIEAKNVLNDRGLINGDIQEQAATRLRPMTIGMEFNARFD